MEKNVSGTLMDVTDKPFGTGGGMSQLRECKFSSVIGRNKSTC